MQKRISTVLYFWFILILPSGASAQLYLNEFIASNDFTIADEHGNYADWLEIYNADTLPIDVAGMYVTDDFSNLTKWEILSGNSGSTMIPATGHLMIWLDDDTVLGQLHANFKLKKVGEQIALVASDQTTIIDSLTFGVQTTDISFGRKPDGSNDWRFFNQPTPGLPNISQGSAGIVDIIPEFSLVAGFYNGPQFLNIAADTGVIRYTLDGSAPNDSSSIAVGLISLDSSVVIKARVFVVNQVPGKVVSNSFFIDENFSTRSLPVVSLSSHPDHFWDADTGIYMQSFKPLWEHPVEVEFFLNDGTREFDQRGGVKILGSNTWVLPQKKLGVFFRSNYGDRDVDYHLFPSLQPEEFRSFELRASGDDWCYSMLRDGLCQLLVENYMELETQAFRPASVFINGEYLGLHNLRNRMDDWYLETTYGIDHKDVDIIENDGVVDEGDSIAYWQMMNFILSNNLSNPANFGIADSLIDLKSYTDWLIGQVYYRNIAVAANVKMWRPKCPGGKWRWFFTDFDHALQGIQGNGMSWIADSTTSYLPNWLTAPTQRLLANTQFREQFISKMADHLYVTFHQQRFEELLYELRSKVEHEMPYQIDRWAGQGWMSCNAIPSMPFWNLIIDSAATIAAGRNDWVRQDLIGYFGLAQETTLSLAITPPHTGQVLINELLIPNDSAWSGKYISNLPVELTIIPKDGYRFVKWIGVDGIDSLQNSIHFTVDSTGAHITALFTEDTTAMNSLVINEINYISASLPDAGDWAELYNPNDYAVDISDWEFYGGNDLFKIQPNTIIEGLGFIVLVNNRTSFESVYGHQIPIVGNLPFKLGNSGEELLLYNHEGQLIDSLQYQNRKPWPMADSLNGASIELIASHLFNELGENWQASIPPGGTPGKANSDMGIHVGGIAPQTIQTGDPFITISLSEHLYDPEFSAGQISWATTGNQHINVSIDTVSHVATITYTNWRGFEEISFIATNPAGQSASDKALFVVGTILPEILGCPVSLQASGSPYIALSNLVIPDGCSLNVSENVQILMSKGTNIMVAGHCQFNGSLAYPISILPISENWGAILLDSLDSPGRLCHVLIKGATNGLDSVRINAAISSYNSETEFNNLEFTNCQRSIFVLDGAVHIDSCLFRESNFGEKVHLRYAQALLENSMFEFTHGDNDAVDFDAIDGGIIRNNTLLGGGDDGLDLGWVDEIACSNMLLERNFLKNFVDKGISIGEHSQNISIHHNVILHSDMGIAVKDSSDAQIDHNTLYENDRGILCYEKNPGFGGGLVTVTNSIIANSLDSAIVIDSISEMYISRSLANTEMLPGVYNLLDEPFFVNPSTEDFTLAGNSPCIDAGDPSLSPDPDSTRSDIGAFYFHQTPDSTSGISEVLAPRIQIYPNPATDHVYFLIRASEEIQVSVYDSRGKIVLNKVFNQNEGQPYQMKCDNLSAGLYYSIVSGPDINNSMHKIVVMESQNE